MQLSYEVIGHYGHGRAYLVRRHQVHQEHSSVCCEDGDGDGQHGYDNRNIDYSGDGCFQGEDESLIPVHQTVYSGKCLHIIEPSKKDHRVYTREKKASP